MDSSVPLHYVQPIEEVPDDRCDYAIVTSIAPWKSKYTVTQQCNERIRHVYGYAYQHRSLSFSSVFTPRVDEPSGRWTCWYTSSALLVIDLKCTDPVRHVSPQPELHSNVEMTVELRKQQNSDMLCNQPHSVHSADSVMNTSMCTVRLSKLLKKILDSSLKIAPAQSMQEQTVLIQQSVTKDTVDRYIHLIDTSLTWQGHMRNTDKEVLSTREQNTRQVAHANVTQQLLDKSSSFDIAFTLLAASMNDFYLKSPLENINIVTSLFNSFMPVARTALLHEQVQLMQLQKLSFILPLLMIILLSTIAALVVGISSLGSRQTTVILIVVHMSCSFPGACCLLNTDYSSVDETMFHSHEYYSNIVSPRNYGGRFKKEIQTQRMLKVELRGSPNAGYCAPVSIGKGHPQQFCVLVDTGSSNFAIAGQPDPIIDKYFHSELSTTFEDLQQSVSVTYTDGDWTGTLSTDYISVGMSDSIPVNFVLIQRSNNFYLPNTEWQGIIGMAFSSLSKPTSSVSTFWDDLRNHYNMADIFSLQLCSPSDSAFRSNHTDGLLTLGGVNESDFHGNIFYTDIVEQKFYSVIITNLSIGDTPVQLDCTEFNNDQTIVDSGTTDIFFPKKVFSKVKQIIISHFQANRILIPVPESFWEGGSKLAWPTNDRNTVYRSFPNISIGFGLSDRDNEEFRLVIPPQIYLRQVQGSYEEQTDTDCFPECTFYVFGVKQREKGTVIGGNAMLGFYTVFNRTSSQVGFAQPVLCNYEDVTTLPQIIGPYLREPVDCRCYKCSGGLAYWEIIIYVCAGVILLLALCSVALLIFSYIKKCRKSQRCSKLKLVCDCRCCVYVKYKMLKYPTVESSNHRDYQNEMERNPEAAYAILELNNIQNDTFNECTDHEAVTSTTCSQCKSFTQIENQCSYDSDHSSCVSDCSDSEVCYYRQSGVSEYLLPNSQRAGENHLHTKISPQSKKETLQDSGFSESIKQQYVYLRSQPCPCHRCESAECECLCEVTEDKHIAVDESLAFFRRDFIDRNRAKNDHQCDYCVLPIDGVPRTLSHVHRKQSGNSSWDSDSSEEDA